MSDACAACSGTGMHIVFTPNGEAPNLLGNGDTAEIDIPCDECAGSGADMGLPTWWPF